MYTVHVVYTFVYICTYSVIACVMYVPMCCRAGDTNVPSQLSSVDITSVLDALITALDQAGKDPDISMEEGRYSDCI